MKSRGRTVSPLTAEQKRIAEEYLNGKDGYRDLAAKYGVGESGIRYWVKKYKAEKQKECENNG